MRFNENVLEAMKALALIESQAAQLDKAVFEKGYNLDSKEVYEAAMYLYESVGMFIESLEDLDENLDPHNNNLPDLDEVFGNHPVTDYVNAVVNVAAGSGKVEQVQETAKKLADFQNEVYGDKKVGFGSLEDFIEYMLEDLGVESGSYAESFKRELVKAIEILKNRPGYSKFLLSFNNQTLEGTLNVSDEEVHIEIGGKEYRFVAEEAKEEEYNGFCSEYPEEDAADDEDLHPYLGYCCPDCECDCEEEEDFEEIPLVEYIKEIDETHAEEINENLDMIEQSLDNKAEFGEDDVQLIRYYLSHLPGNSNYDVEALSDKALKLAYRQRQLVRNIK